MSKDKCTQNFISALLGLAIGQLKYNDYLESKNIEDLEMSNKAMEAGQKAVNEFMSEIKSKMTVPNYPNGLEVVQDNSNND